MAQANPGVPLLEAAALLATALHAKPDLVLPLLALPVHHHPATVIAIVPLLHDETPALHLVLRVHAALPHSAQTVMCLADAMYPVDDRAHHSAVVLEEAMGLGGRDPDLLRQDIWG
jgi:hypothetical protein